MILIDIAKAVCGAAIILLIVLATNKCALATVIVLTALLTIVIGWKFMLLIGVSAIVLILSLMVVFFFVLIWLDKRSNKNKENEIEAERLYLIDQIRKEWFPNRKYVFFLYSNSEKWEKYFQDELMPKIQEKTVIRNWSTRHEDGWENNSIESKIISVYKYKYRRSRRFFPIAIVFLPSGEERVFQFYEPYVKMLKSGKDDYKNLEQEFLELVRSL